MTSEVDDEQRWRSSPAQLSMVRSYWREMQRVLKPGGVYVVVSLRQRANLEPLLASGAAAAEAALSASKGWAAPPPTTAAGQRGEDAGASTEAAAQSRAGQAACSSAQHSRSGCWRILEHIELPHTPGTDQALPAHVYVCSPALPAPAAPANGRQSSLDTID